MALPTTTAEGSLTLAEENLARTIAGCARWQTIADAEDATEGLANIYIDALPTPRDEEEVPLEVYSAEQLAELRPFALISQPPRQSYRAERIGDASYGEAGSLVILFEFAVDAEDRDEISEAFRKIKNDLGVLLTEMQALAYEPGYLAIDRFQVDGPWRCEDDAVNDLGDHVFAIVTVYWNGGLQA